MPGLPRSHLIAYLLAALAVLGFGWRQVAEQRDGDARSGVPIATEAQADGAESPGPGSGTAKADPSTAPAGKEGDLVVVHVAGVVRRPGVYRLAEGLRVNDALRAAGGARRGADLAQLNLAMKLEDGRQVLVPRRGAAAASASAGSASSAEGGSAGFGAAPTAQVNLNTASVEELDTLDGVGPVTAEKIFAAREESGGFSSIEDLGEIPGIGPKTLESLREQVTL